MNLTYPVILETDEDGSVIVSFPDFKEAITFGDNIEHALKNAKNSLEEAIYSYIATRNILPDPSEIINYSVEANLLVNMKASLYSYMQANNIKKADLAKLLGKNQKQIDRILDLNHNSTIEQFELAFSALGKKLSLNIEEPKTANEPKLGIIKKSQAILSTNIKYDDLDKKEPYSIKKTKATSNLKMPSRQTDLESPYPEASRIFKETPEAKGGSAFVS